MRPLAALMVGRSERTIRRWATQGVDIRNESKLKAFVAGAEKRSFGRYGRSGRLMGKKGGSKTSDAKRKSSKRNGRSGGRPRDGMELLIRSIRNNNALDLKGATAADLKAVWHSLTDIDARLGFWIGDALIEIERRGGPSSLKQAISQSHDPKLFRDHLELSRAFSPGARRF